MSNRLTSKRWIPVLLGSLWVVAHMGSTTDHPMSAMTSSMTVVTCTALPRGYTTLSRVVLASRTPMTAVVVASRIGPGAHVLGACCHQGARGPTRGCNTALCCQSHVRIMHTMRPRGTRTRGSLAPCSVPSGV